MNILPCNSAKNSRSMPDFKCSPSIFWLTTYFTCPVSIRAFNAWWVFDGIASSNEMLMFGFSPFFSSVQTPFGPLFIPNVIVNIMLIQINKGWHCWSLAYRKSGIPTEVLMPAPVWTTTCFAAKIIWANLAHFSVTVFSSSKTFAKWTIFV